MNSITHPALISRATILIVCGVLAIMLATMQVPPHQRMNVVAACLVGMIAFASLENDSNHHSRTHEIRKREVSQALLNRRIQLHLASMDCSIRDQQEVVKSLES